MRRIVYTRPDGGLCVVHPVRNTIGETLITDEEIELRAFGKLPLDAINPQFVEASVLPQDRTFRNAWKQNGSLVEHDMVKARDIHRDTLRSLRKPKLEVLDMAYLRADELGDVAEKARIAAKKQALRDVTDDQRIEAAQTPEQLKAVLPDVLK